MTSPGVVRFNPEITTSDGPEELAEDQGQEEKFLEREIIQYLQKYKYEDNKNIWPAKRGRIKKWNLVRQTFHENREVFFSGVPRVTQDNPALTPPTSFRSRESSLFILSVSDPVFGRS